MGSLNMSKDNGLCWTGGHSMMATAREKKNCTSLWTPKMCKATTSLVAFITTLCYYMMHANRMMTLFKGSTGPQQALPPFQLLNFEVRNPTGHHLSTQDMRQFLPSIATVKPWHWQAHFCMFLVQNSFPGSQDKERNQIPECFWRYSQYSQNCKSNLLTWMDADWFAVF